MSIQVTFTIEDDEVTTLDEVASSIEVSLSMPGNPPRIWVGKDHATSMVFDVSPNYTVREVQ